MHVTFRQVTLARYFTYLLILLVCVAVGSGLATAQEFRGSISGQVTDSSGAVVVGAKITVTNVATNVSQNSIANDNGDYSVLYLTPGVYTILAEAKGFKRAIRKDLEVRVGEKLTLNFGLTAGGIEETINVGADAPLLESSTASAGQVIDSRRIADLPLSDGNPFVLSRLAPGIAYVGDLKFSRPFDNSGASAIISDGSPGKNEFTLDGSPNMAGTGGTNGAGRAAFFPPADAVQEFKVETSSFDAQQGHTGGAVVNVTLKSGTNQLHGTLYEFLRNDALSGNDFFLKRSQLTSGQPNKPSTTRYNRYGGTIGGPIFIPKVYNGKDRTFFFFSYEGLRDVFPEPATFTVPTVAERNGDFSALLAQNITIFDPATAVAQGSRVHRDPISCNGQANVICANRINAVAKAYLAFYPLPNQPGDASGLNNFFSPQNRNDVFSSESVRVDHMINEKQKFFVRYTHNWRREDRNNWTGTIGGVIPTGNFLYRINNGVTYDHIYTVNPTTILNFRVGYSRFYEQNQRESEGVFNPGSLGFSAATAALFNGASYFPQFNFTGSNTFSNLGNSQGDLSTYNIYSYQANLTKIVRSHSLRAGYDFRSYRENAYPARHGAGRYDFSTNFTRGPLDNSSGAAIGQDLASMLLGLPTGGIIDNSAARADQTLYHGLFFQDDWKVNAKLTLNLGLRYEYEPGMTERFNRNLRGFDSTSSNPIEAAAKAAYAANPIPQVDPGTFNVKGGLLFADSNNRSIWDGDKNNFQPRIGGAFQINGKTVVRGGYAVYMVPFTIDANLQTGFSLATNIVPTNDNGLTFVANLTNPFPGGVQTPPGSSQGLATLLGQSITVVPVKRKNGMAHRWEVNFQRELPGQWLLELSYVGTRGVDLTTTSDLNPIPRSFLSTSLVRDDVTNNLLTASVTNPFKGLVPGSNMNGSTVARSQLLRPFPEFTGVSSQRYDGSSIYHSGQALIERRFSKGFTLTANYTWSKSLERVSLLNPTDTNYESRLNQSDAPHRFVAHGIWELPFGKGHKLGNDWNGPVNTALGGWQVQGIWQLQSGVPLSWGNLYYNGDPTKLSANIGGGTVNGAFDTTGFYFHDAAVQTNGVDDPAKQRADQRIRLVSNVRTFPSRLPNFRGEGQNLFDFSLAKTFAINERVRLQFRSEFLNAINHAQLDNPSLDPTSSNFGKITQQLNLPRQVQMGLKLIF